MDQTRDELGILRELIKKETRFLRHYTGQVLSNADTENKGRVFVSIPALGWEKQSEAAWCSPRERHSLDLPEVHEWVEVYFMGGDENRPVYMGIAQEMKGMVPKAFDGKVRVLFQDPKTDESIEYDPENKTLALKGKGKNFVTHAELDSALQGFISTYNAHVHATAATGPPVPPTGTPASLDISSAKTDNVTTDG